MRNSTRTWSELYPDALSVVERGVSEKACKRSAHDKAGTSGRNTSHKHWNCCLGHSACTTNSALGERETQYVESEEQKLFLRLVGSGEDDVAHRAGKEVRH